MKVRFWMVALFVAAFVFATVNFTGCGIYRRITAVSGSGDDTVVVTGTSGYYHRMSCRNVGIEHKELFLSDALQIDYKPCPTCRPPRLKEVQD
jgi:hypothetical protein